MAHYGINRPAVGRKVRRRRMKRARPGLVVARAPARGVAAPANELKPLPQYYFKRTTPLPPPATTLLPNGQKRIKNGKLQHRYLTSDSRKIGRPFTTGPSFF